MIALAMWRTSFGGVNDFGLGSAIAVFLFLLVIPILAAQHPPLPEGGRDGRDRRRPEPRVPSSRSRRRRKVAARPRRRRRSTSSWSFVGLLWLVPTIGLFFTSLLAPADDRARAGWWKIFTQPSLRDVRELPGRSSTTRRSRRSLWTTLWIAIGGDGPARSSSPRSPATRSPGSSSPGRDWLFIVVIALLVVPLQMALIPIFSLYNDLGIFDTMLGPDPLPHGVRAAVRDLPAAQLLHRDPEGPARGGADRRRVGAPDLLAADPAARPARRSRRSRSSSSSGSWNDLLVALTFGARHAADHRRDLLPAAPVRLEHRADRAGRVRLARDPARRLLRLPALLRPGAARRLGEMSLDGLAARSVAVIREHQAASGAYLAAPFPAAYRNAWLRDGAFVADAMSRAGERASAEAFFSWCAGVVEARAERMAAREILDGRFTVDGHRCPASGRRRSSTGTAPGSGRSAATYGGTASTPRLGFRPRGRRFDMPPIAGTCPVSTGGRSGAGCMSRRSLPSTAG